MEAERPTGTRLAPISTLILKITSQVFAVRPSKQSACVLPPAAPGSRSHTEAKLKRTPGCLLQHKSASATILDPEVPNLPTSFFLWKTNLHLNLLCAATQKQAARQTMPHLSLPRLPTIFQRHIYWKSMGCAKQADYLSDQIILRSLPGLLVLPPLSDRRDSTPIFCLRSQKQRGIMSPGHHRNRKHSFSRKCQQGDIFARGLGGGRKGPLLERERIFLGPPARPQKVQ